MGAARLGVVSVADHDLLEGLANPEDGLGFSQRHKDLLQGLA